jgi:hypothetical protein
MQGRRSCSVKNYCCETQRNENRIKSGGIFEGMLWLKRGCFATDGGDDSKGCLSPVLMEYGLAYEDVNRIGLAQDRAIGSGEGSSPITVAMNRARVSWPM